MKEDKELPVLPEPCLKGINWSQGYFDKTQLQAYGAACAAHAREEAETKYSSLVMAVDEAMKNGILDIGIEDAIEALKKAGK